jgi:predicted RNase H-like nuclease (RuvC/YqgF family)
MTLNELYTDKHLINDETEIYVKRRDIYTKGGWHQDNIQKYSDAELQRFEWIENNHLFVYLKE